MTLIFPAWSHLNREDMGALRAAASNAPNPVEVCDEITPREDWMSVASANIRLSDCVLLILTADSAISRHCAEEVSFAHSIGKPTLIWSPGEGPTPPDWASHAICLSPSPIDAAQAVVRTVVILSRSSR